MSIATECMTANLQIGVWEARKLDKRASKDVTDRAGANADAARVNKQIIPKETLAPIVTLANALRKHYYDHTVPWKDNGERLVTRRMYPRFIAGHEKLKGEFDAAVRKFIEEDYGPARDQAEFRMGELFEPSDYPATNLLYHKFYAHCSIDTVTTAGDFRVQMDEATVDSIKSTIEQDMARRMAGAVKDVWERVAKVVGHYQSTMADPDKTFRDTTVENLYELIDLLPGLNITGDPELERAYKEMNDNLKGIEPKDLRKDAEARKFAASKAAEVLDIMKGFMPQGAAA